MDYSPRDEREIKNRFSSYEEIDERQTLELLLLLDKWEKGEMLPCDVMLDAMNAVGARPSYMISYEVGLNHKPGTPNFEKTLKRAREHAAERYEKIGFEAASYLNQTKTRIQELKEGRTDGPPHENMFGSVIDPNDGSKKPLTPLADVIARMQKELDGLIAGDPELGRQLHIRDDIQGTRSYVDSIQDMIRIRDEAAASGNIAFRLVAELNIARARKMKKEAEDGHLNIERVLAEAVRDGEKKWQEEIDDVHGMMRPEVLKNEPVIAANIRAIRERLENGIFDSWQGALAMMQVLLRDEKQAPGGSQSYIREFTKDLEREKSDLEHVKPNPQTTIDLMKPVSEDTIKFPLARQYAEKRAYEVWKTEKEKTFPVEYRASHGKDPDKYALRWATDFDAFRDEGKPGVPENDADIPFQPPIDYPDRKVCGEIYIEPTGTALVEIYDVHEYEDSFDRDIYGTPVGRITTYTVTFVPRTSADLDDLQKTLSRALEVLGDMDYQYHLSDRYNPSGDMYARVHGTPEKREEDNTEYRGLYSSNYIRKQGDRLTPDAEFDLDDLWRLYFLMEPVIEPSSQIAAAMNAARYAEERGAVLSPREEYVYNGHEIADPLASLQKGENEDLLAAALRDALVSRALNKIDNPELTMRLSTLAGHTLTGQIADRHGVFPVFDSLLADLRTAGKAVITFDEALKERTSDLMRAMVGIGKDSPIPIADALSGVLAKIARPLQEQYRDREKTERRAMYERLNKRWSREDGASSWQSIMKTFDEDEFGKRLSDIFALRAGRTEEQINESHKKALTSGTSLIVAASRVETAIDGIHAGGRYRTRTKGSPWARYELPKSLQPFAPQDKYQPSKLMIPSLKNL